MQLFLIENGQPINMNSDYRGIIVLEEHIDEVSLCPPPPLPLLPVISSDRWQLVGEC